MGSNSGISLKHESAGRHVPPIEYILLTPPLSLLLNAVYLTEKQQIQMLYYLVYLTGVRAQYHHEENTLTITPLSRFIQLFINKTKVLLSQA